MSGLRYAIADPPYLGRGARYYGPGTNGRKMFGSGMPGRAQYLKTSEHQDAHLWDDPATHAELISDLTSRYDGWAVALARDSLLVYLTAAPPDVRIAVWHKVDIMPAARIREVWEPVLLYVPPDRRARGTGPPVRDLLSTPVPHVGHVGAKPRSWTRWVLDLLGATDRDTVVDLFPGSGMVANEIAQTVLFEIT